MVYEVGDFLEADLCVSKAALYQQSGEHCGPQTSVPALRIESFTARCSARGCYPQRRICPNTGARSWCLFLSAHLHGWLDKKSIFDCSWDLKINHEADRMRYTHEQSFPFTVTGTD